MCIQTCICYLLVIDITLWLTDALKLLIEACQPGVKVLDLCELGDKILNEETLKVFKKDKEMRKGLQLYSTLLKFLKIKFCALFFRFSLSSIFVNLYYMK